MAYLMNKTPDVSSTRLEMKDIYREVSTARQALKDSYQNLQDVADYCEKNFTEAPDKRKALESTMSLVTQTLASVACQVGVAARHVSDMLEVQSLMLQKEEVRVRYVAQLLDVHVEKVARQKIGKMTTAKKFQHCPKIQNGQNRPLGSYSRMPISFTSLDNTGHGITDSDSQLSRTGTMSRRSVKTMGQTQSSLGRNSRARDPVAPPYIPAQKFQCPISPDTISPKFANPTRINGDFPLPPPEPLDPSTHQTQQSLETDSNFPDTYSLLYSDLPPPPPPESDVNGSLWLPAPIAEGSNFPDTYSLPYSDFPPPSPEFDMNGSLWSPTHVMKDNQIPICKSVERVDECFPPPPVIDNGENPSPWPIGNGLTSLMGTQHSADDLPPPPAPDSEMTQVSWAEENADSMESSSYLDDLPPPPDF
ncbi:uncharacterized protein ACNLHF_019031 [Anomaloglossus baeobatrachus]|uniref:uncharacterized protein LOC142310225 n=1 Tax=Anomaloglossus baeobatrachus TaxID=238106 RepID=UPI003F4FF46F